MGARCRRSSSTCLEALDELARATVSGQVSREEECSQLRRKELLGFFKGKVAGWWIPVGGNHKVQKAELRKTYS